MSFKPFQLVLIIFFCTFGFKASANIINSNILSNNQPLNSNLSIQKIGLNDTLLNETFIAQEFNYYAPQSGEVFLVWSSENYPLEESVSWNKDTKLIDNLLYTPMVAKGDSFYTRLKVASGTNLAYYFWVTKNNQGLYQDFWDIKSSGKIIVTTANPISKTANFSKFKEKKTSSIINNGWIIFLLILVLYIIIWCVRKKWGNSSKRSSRIENVIFTGLSLLLFHVLARSDIIGISPRYIFTDSINIFKIIKASLNDIIYVSGLVLIFVIALWKLKNQYINQFLFTLFLFLAGFSVLIAFINITTVIFLGNPLNYQWLYYSDFLGSTDAKTAFAENLSISIIANLMAFWVSMFMLSQVFIIAYNLIPSRKYVIYNSIFCVGALLLMIGASQVKNSCSKGQSENAVTTFISSMITANTNPSLFSMQLSNQNETFNLDQIPAVEKSYGTFSNSPVKNVLFIVLESAGASYFDAYGGKYQLSPNLNKYSSQALMFSQMYAHAPATNRSLVSILGSMYPYLSYKSLTQEAPDFKHPTLSSILKEKGYRTSFFSSADLNFQNSKQFLANRGFDRIEDYSAIQCARQYGMSNSDYKEGNGIDDMCLASKLTSWLDEDQNKNFFSVLWTVQGHYPYFYENEEEDFGESNFSFNRYLNVLKYNDHLIGTIMQSLKDRNLDKTTLVVVTGDHGEAFGQHQQFGHGTSIYEENLRVPLYFINPSLFHGEVKNDIAGMKDLASTTLALLQMDIPKIWQGRDLTKTNYDEAFFFAPWSDYLFGYRKENMKYIFNETLNKVEIYDLNNDPKEKVNLFNEKRKEEIEKARNRMAAWVQYQDQYIKGILKSND